MARFSELFAQAESPDPIERWLEADQRMYLCDDILTKVDVASMAVSLECRAPLLDHRLAEHANRIPLRQKLRGGQTKVLLRRLAERRLPRAVVTLPKRGFTLPLAVWLRGELHDWAHSLIFGPASWWEPFLRPRAVRRLWDEHQGGRADHSMRLWVVLGWVLWRASDAGRRA